MNMSNEHDDNESRVSVPNATARQESDVLTAMEKAATKAGMDGGIAARATDPGKMCAVLAAVAGG